MSTMEQRFREAIDRVYRDTGEDAFFGWFDADSGAEAALKDGSYGFAVSILRDPVPKFLSKPQDKVALEIGYGGGRLLHAAALMFKEAIGVDIHTKSQVVDKLLRSKGVSNFRLYECSGKEIPIESATVDFVYSNIVFIHLSGPDVLESYLSESHRVLKPGGIASFYYGRPFSYRASSSNSSFTSIAYHALEPLAETLLLDLARGGYRTNPEGRANSATLMVTRRRMRRLAKASGLDVLSLRTRRKWQQGHIVLRKQY